MLLIRRGALLLLLFLLAGCDSSPSVGSTGPGGGVVFYVDPSGFPCGSDGSAVCTYLEAAPVDAERALPWYRTAVPPILTNSVSVGSGPSNSASFAGWAADTAVGYALGYEHAGRSDWFLPSKEELRLLYENKDVVGGFSEDFYWSSSVDSTGKFWGQGFREAAFATRVPPSLSGGLSVLLVRPVRAG